MKNHQHRLIVASSFILRIGICGCQHRHVLPWASQHSVKFVRVVHPHRRQSLHDGMLRLLRLHLKWQPRPMLSCRSRRRIGYQLSILDMPIGTRILRAISPPADADHFVICRPVRKRIVGGVHNNQSSAVAHILLETRAQVGRPVRCVVVHHDRLVMVQIRLKAAEVLVRRRRGHNRHRKQPRLFEFLLQNGSRQSPVVISSATLSIQD